MEFSEHNMRFKTNELAAILSCVLATLEEKPEGECEPLENALVSVAEKISLELGLSPISIPDPVHIA